MTNHIDSHPFQQDWVKVPDLDHKAQISAARAQSKLVGILREKRAQIAFIQINNLKEPPRRSHITYWYHRTKGYQGQAAGADTPQNVVELDIGIDMVPIAIDLYRRWPTQERPLTIALLSDGYRLLYNPGRPEGDPTEILAAHRSGIAPAAILLGPKDNRVSHLSSVFGA